MSQETLYFFDSLAISHSTKTPITLDSIHTNLLKFKTQCKKGLNFSIIDKFAQIGYPDFGDLTLDEILKLRKDSAIQSFRKLIEKIGSGLQSGSNLSIEKLYNEELLEYIKEIVPTKKTMCSPSDCGRSYNCCRPWERIKGIH